MSILLKIVQVILLILIQVHSQDDSQLEEQIKNNEILYIQQICMTYSESQCKQFNYDNYLNKKPVREQIEDLNEMSKQLKHMHPHLEFKLQGNDTIVIVPNEDIPDGTYLFSCNSTNCISEAFNPKTFYNYHEMKNDFNEFQKILDQFTERNISCFKSTLAYGEYIKFCVKFITKFMFYMILSNLKISFSLYLPHIPTQMNCPLFSFGLPEMQVLTTADPLLLRKLMKKRFKIQNLWQQFQNVTSNYTVKQMSRIFGFKQERLVDFADFSWALLHVLKYASQQSSNFYIVPGIEFVRQQNDYLKKFSHETEGEGQYNIYCLGTKKGKALYQHYTMKPHYYFIYNREINHNHPKECVNLQIISEEQTGQCMQDILYYANIVKGKICVRKDKEFLKQIDILIGVINLKRSFSCKCKDDISIYFKVNKQKFKLFLQLQIGETIYKNHNINLIDSLNIIKDKCLSGKDHDPKNYQQDIRPKFQAIIDRQKREYNTYLSKLADQEYVLKNLQGIYFDNLDLLYKYILYKKKAIEFLERGIQKAYAFSDQYKSTQQHSHSSNQNQSKQDEEDEWFKEEKIDL